MFSQRKEGITEMISLLQKLGVDSHSEDITSINLSHKRLSERDIAVLGTGTNLQKTQ